MFLEKAVLKRCSKFTGEHPCRSVISIKLQSNFIESTLWHGCCPVNLLHIFRRTAFSKNTSGGLLLESVAAWMKMFLLMATAYINVIEKQTKVKVFCCEQTREVEVYSFVYTGIEIAVGHRTLSDKKCYMSGTHVSKQDILPCILLLLYVKS